MKRAFKNAFFSSCGWAISKTGHYQRWKQFNAQEQAVGTLPEVPPTLAPELTREKLAMELYRPLRERHPEYSDPWPRVEPTRRYTTRAIAFFLPQFHTVPENDNWWGEGFTEWTNVTKAVPQFVGHYQPHLPGALGFYDLTNPEILKKQAKLARAYGIEGFCIYHYWFGGRRILEKPAELLLSHPDIDINYCLCWANENWTRRWDGLESDVLLGQQHSPADDIAFIESMFPYFRDERYIRIEGKPVLVVYRPSLLPDAGATAARWREACRAAGIGEIYLMATHSFERIDPRSIGFDGATQFAPNGSGVPVRNNAVNPIWPEYRGNVFDYRDLVATAAVTPAADFDLFRCVAPGWDNSARKPGFGNTFINSTPRAYGEWLAQACSDTLRRFSQNKRLVFINAWNEWAEGAHLEPDRYFGHAYLEKTREILDQFEPRALVNAKPEKIGVIVHLFYFDLWSEILRYLRNIPAPFNLYVSVVEGVPAEVVAEIEREFPDATILKCSNRGRDVLPFLRCLEIAVKDGCTMVCKIHTKKSLHRTDGDKWRRDLYDKLLGSTDGIRAILRTLSARPSLGIVGPAGHKVSSDVYWGSNAEHLGRLACALGFEPEKMSFEFIAGTMFWARTEAISPLLSFGLDDADFESEGGQVDGTLAHAIERLLPLAARAKGYWTADTSVTESESADR